MHWFGATDTSIAPVKFNLIDSIVEISDTRIVAVKHVSLAEEYLADHFPTFPVLPGVMMLEAITQAAAWLMHRRQNFAKSMAVLKEARNVKYGQFVAPGNYLRVDVEWTKATDAIIRSAVGTWMPCWSSEPRTRPNCSAHAASKSRTVKSWSRS